MRYFHYCRPQISPALSLQCLSRFCTSYETDTAHERFSQKFNKFMNICTYWKNATLHAKQMKEIFNGRPISTEERRAFRLRK